MPQVEDAKFILKKTYHTKKNSCQDYLFAIIPFYQFLLLSQIFSGIILA